MCKPFVLRFDARSGSLTRTQVIQTLGSINTELQEGYTIIPCPNVHWEWADVRTGQVAVTTRAHTDFCLNSRLDRDLRFFVARLMSVGGRLSQPRTRPTLRQALNICLHSVRMTPEQMFPLGAPPGESDEEIRDYVAAVVLNANFSPPSM
jgi:hypothetical protein